MPRRPTRTALALSLSLASGLAHAQAPTRSVALEVLVLDDGEFATKAFIAGLDEALVPYRSVKINAAHTPIDEAFLIEQTGSMRRANYQAVVLPNAAPSGLSAVERTALNDFEREFKIRELNAYVYPSASVGLQLAAAGEFDFDKGTASVEKNNAGSAFAYLRGDVLFEDDPDVPKESSGYLAAATSSFTPFVSMTTASGSSGVVLGVFNDGSGREQMVLTAAMNENQFQFQALFPGMLSWLTYGVHLGSERNYLAVHVDDVFLANARWNKQEHCTGGVDRDGQCPIFKGDDRSDLILMSTADVDALEAFQRRTGLYLDLAFNGDGYRQANQTLADLEAQRAAGGEVTERQLSEARAGVQLIEYLIARAGSFRWINHTFTHDNLDDPSFATYDKLYGEITYNIAFALDQLRVGPTLFSAQELVTGQHSGLAGLAVPRDNPNLAQALTDSGVLWIGADDSLSTEKQQRSIQGDSAIFKTLTVPRYPMNIYYNVARKDEEIDEYKWTYALPADGGNCKPSETTTCLKKPLDPVKGFDDYILGKEANIALKHVLKNSPRPHYVHQSNLAEDRILYPMLDAVLRDYGATFDSSVPLMNLSMAQFGEELRLQTRWRKHLTNTRSQLKAYVEGGRLVIKRQGYEEMVPLTLPEKPSETIAGIDAYSGVYNGWHSPAAEASIALPVSVAYSR